MNGQRVGAATATPVCSGTAGRRQLCSHEAKRARHDRFHVAAVHDEVEHAVLDQELAALKAVRQLLPDGLLDDAGTGKADERLGLGDVEVAEHREARR
jgi:hypothetical protein